jgi:hypothetical protein
MQLVFDDCRKYPKGEFNKEFKSDKWFLRNAAFYTAYTGKKPLHFIHISYNLWTDAPYLTYVI